MKAILEFNLPEENHEWGNAIEGAKMRSVLWEMDQWLRAKMKYEDLPNHQYEVYKECRKYLRDLTIEENIDLDK
jgi:hypothetical protein